MSLINRENLEEKSLTNAEVLAILEMVGDNVDMYGYSRILDAIENLTGDRDFEDMKIYDAKDKLEKTL